jgi:hypothetical protein
MSRSATFIDIAVVERTTPDFELGTRSRDQWRYYVGKLEGNPKTVDEVLAQARNSWDDSVRIHYRVIKALKARGPERFDISGTLGVVAPRPRVPGAATRPLSGLGKLKYLLDQRDLAEWQGFGVCNQQVAGKVGTEYLVFRNAQGRLLHTMIPTRFNRFAGSNAGPAAVPISGEHDAWVLLVVQTLARTH